MGASIKHLIENQRGAPWLPARLPKAVGELRGGEACSAGIARGTAKVMSSISEAGRVQPGDVLVADALSPSWTPLFKTAAAIVSNTGGILSHAAVVAREYGVPAVLGAPAATTSIRDGQMVEVDGAAGLVRVVSRPPQTS
jgi:rifampicin phosphotransferase